MVDLGLERYCLALASLKIPISLVLLCFPHFSFSCSESFTSLLMEQKSIDAEGVILENLLDRDFYPHL